MKIHEIITENNVSENTVKALGDIAVKGLGKVMGKDVGRRAGIALRRALRPSSAAAGKASTAGKAFLSISKLGAGALTILKYLGLASIVNDYITAVNAGQANVDKGEWTEEEFQDFRQGEMTKLVLAIATSTVLFTAIKIFSGFSIFVRLLKLSKFPAIQAFAITINSLAEGARVAFIGFLVSDAGKEARKDIGDLIGRGIIDTTLGGNGVALVDKVQHWLDPKHREGTFKNPLNPTPADAGGDKASDTTSDATDTATNGTSAKTSDDSDFAYDKSKYTRGPRGELIPKLNIEK